MKKRTFQFQNQVDEFAIQLLHNYAEGVRQEMEAPSPFFTTRLRTRISQEQQASQFWEFGVISAQKWLVALSCIALLFFFGNLVAVGTQTHLLSHTSLESSHNELEDGDDIHSSDEALNVDMLQKE